MTPPDTGGDGGGGGGQQILRTLRISNKRGLHARAAARFVKLADSFQSEITVQCKGQTVSGVSIMGLMMLAASRGTEITVAALGLDAAVAIQAIADLVNGRFEED